MRWVHVPGSGPTVVLIHGASGCSATWDRSAWSWADLWLVDLPGRGAALAEVPQAEVTALAAGLHRALVGVPGASIHLVGHSLGGGIALQLVLDHPYLWKSAGGPVAGLVMLASSARLGVAPATLEAVRRSTEAAPFHLDFAFGPATTDATRAQYAERTAGVPPAASLADWTACDGFDVRARLHTLDLPVLALYGDHDVLTPPKHQERLVQALPNARGVVLPGLGHMAPFEDPTAVAEAVRGWVAER